MTMCYLFSVISMQKSDVMALSALEVSILPMSYGSSYLSSSFYNLHKR